MPYAAHRRHVLVLCSLPYAACVVLLVRHDGWHSHDDADFGLLCTMIAALYNDHALYNDRELCTMIVQETNM